MLNIGAISANKYGLGKTKDSRLCKKRRLKMKKLLVALGCSLIRWERVIRSASRLQNA